MRGNFFHDQTIFIHNFGEWRIEVDGQIANLERFAGAESLLIFERAIFTYQQIHEARGLGKESGAVRTEDAIDDGSVAAERPGIEESRQVPAVINMQMGQQNRIYIVQVEVQFADAQEGSRPSIH